MVGNLVLMVMVYSLPYLVKLCRPLRVENLGVYVIIIEKFYGLINKMPCYRWENRATPAPCGFSATGLQHGFLV